MQLGLQVYMCGASIFSSLEKEAFSRYFNHDEVKLMDPGQRKRWKEKAVKPLMQLSAYFYEPMFLQEYLLDIFPFPVTSANVAFYHFMKYTSIYFPNGTVSTNSDIVETPLP